MRDLGAIIRRNILCMCDFVAFRCQFTSFCRHMVVVKIVLRSDAVVVTILCFESMETVIGGSLFVI